MQHPYPTRLSSDRGNRFFRCLGRHGSMTMHTAIARSCNTYFYSMGNRIGYDAIAVMARRLGLGEEYPLPVVSQSYGTVRSEEHTSELQSLMRISYAVYCLKKKQYTHNTQPQ